MFKNYLKIIFRTLKRNKVYSTINIMGLAIGLACSILIILYVLNELGYDRFHKNSDNIYRVSTALTMGSNVLDFAIIMGPVGPAMLEDYPEVVDMVRLFKEMKRRFMKYEDNGYYEDDIFFADPSFFDIFSFRLLKGNPKTVLKEPFSMVLTEETARKYFGDEDPIGKRVRYNNKDDYVVTGIVEKAPENSHLKFNILLSFSSLPEQAVQQWRLVRFYTYLKLQDGVSPKNLESKFPAFIEKYIGKDLEEVGIKKWELFLQPLTDIHLHSHLKMEMEPNNHISTIIVFITIAFFILGIACINFMILTVAGSSRRAKEVGVRKVLGAEKKGLVRQFLGETVASSLISLFIALILVKFFLFVFNDVTGQQLALDYGKNWLYLLGFIALGLIVGVLGGIYPAFLLSAFKPVDVMKGELKTGRRGSKLRNILIGLQYFIAIGIIGCTMVMYDQINFIKNKKLGFETEQVLVVPLDSKNVRDRYTALKNEWLKNPGVVGVTAALTYMSDFVEETAALPDGQDDSILMASLTVDYDFTKTMGMEIVRGRAFSKEFPTDLKEAVIINEAAVKTFGWDDPLGKSIKQYNGRGEEIFNHRVIGVVKDFHFASLHQKIKPIRIMLTDWRQRYILIRIKPGNISETIGYLAETWGAFEKDIIFEYFFLDETFDKLYRTEQRLGKIFIYFTFLSILIACLGLFGISSITARLRSKEIGIRKAHGARVSNIVWLILKEFTRLVLVAAVIAGPLAYFVMDRWLQNFAYRTSLDVTTFILSGLAAIAIAILTIGFQVIKAANTDPVKVLRYE